MAKRKRGRRPSEPEEIQAAKRAKYVAAERAKLRAEGVDVSVVELDGVELSHARQAELEAKGAIVEVDHRRRMKSGIAAGHHKADIWWRLYQRETITRDQMNAVRDLQDLMARRAGLGGRDEKKTYDDVRPDEPFRDPCLVSDDMLRAAVEVDLTLELVGPPSKNLLSALLWPSVMGEPHDWREIVARVAKVTYPLAQAVPLQIAAQALLDVKADVQRRLANAAKSKSERCDPQGFGEEPSGRTHPFHAGEGMAR